MRAIHWNLLYETPISAVIKNPEVRELVNPELKVIYWTVTNECNQHCKYCWIDAGKKRGFELTTEQWLQTFEKIVDLGLVRVKITGGEPFLHWPRIWKVIELLVDHGIRLNMETNGTLLCGEHRQDVLEALRNECFTLLSVSLDSHIPSKHDMFRGMKGAFEETTRALALLKENEIPFSIVTVLHNKNYREIQKIIDFVDTMNPLHHQINTIMPEGRTKIYSEYQLSPEFYVNELPSMIKKIKKGEKRKVQFNVPYVFDPLNRDSLTCTVGKEICGLLPTGDIAVCGAGINNRELVLGNVLKDDIGEIWMNSPAFLTLRKDVFESKGICGNCLFARYCRGYCRANAFSVYGELDAPFPICQMLYDQGVFPNKYMIDPRRDCSY